MSEQYYKCKECGLHYENKEIAEKCETWCRENQSCNLDITKHSLESKNRKKK